MSNTLLNQDNPPTKFLTKVFDVCPETGEAQVLVDADGGNGCLTIKTRGKTTAWKHMIRTEEVAP